MGYSIELYFDHEFETRFIEIWKKLEEYDVPSILQKIGSKPHISLSVLDSINEFQALELIEKFADRLSQFEIEFPAIGLIPGNSQTVFLAPTVNSKIIEVQKALYQQLQLVGLKPRKCYEPSNWLPHCTISKELSSSEALKTIEICQNNSLTGKAGVIELGFIEFRPRKEIKKVRLIST